MFEKSAEGPWNEIVTGSGHVKEAIVERRKRHKEGR